MKRQLAEAIAKRNLRNIRKVGRPPIWRFPSTQEVLYRRLLISVVNYLRRQTDEILIALPRILAQRDMETRTDAWPAELDRLLELLRNKFDEIEESDTIKAQLLDIGQKTAKWNDEQWQNTLRQVLGVDVFRRESWLGSHIESFVKEGASLITKLTEDTYHDISALLTRRIRAGDRVETIKKALMSETDLEPGVFKKLETRARLIARDQIGKLNGELTKLRQESIDVERYIWHTVEDERVRESHAALNDKLCRWDDDTVYSDDDGKTWKDRDEIGAFKGKPGDDYQCRCWAEAVFPEEVEESEEP